MLWLVHVCGWYQHYVFTTDRGILSGDNCTAEYRSLSSDPFTMSHASLVKSSVFTCSLFNVNICACSASTDNTLVEKEICSRIYPTRP